MKMKGHNSRLTWMKQLVIELDEHILLKYMLTNKFMIHKKPPDLAEWTFCIAYANQWP